MIMINYHFHWENSVLRSLKVKNISNSSQILKYLLLINLSQSFAQDKNRCFASFASQSGMKLLNALTHQGSACLGNRKLSAVGRYCVFIHSVTFLRFRCSFIKEKCYRKYRLFKT